MRDPVGHTAFSSDDLRCIYFCYEIHGNLDLFCNNNNYYYFKIIAAWLACGRIDWSGFSKSLQEDFDKMFDFEFLFFVYKHIG